MVNEQDTLPTLSDAEQFRHPMWTAPKRDDQPRHVFALKGAISRALVPLDGRQNCELLIEWLAEVYDESQHHKAQADPVWLIGDMTWRRHLFATRINIKYQIEDRPDRRAHLVSQREAMKRIHEQLVEAIILSHL